VTPEFEIEPLGPSHDRKAFSCGVAALDSYFAGIVTQDIKRRLSNCFVARHSSGAVAAFYTLASSGVPLGELAPDVVKRLPRYPLIPAALVGRLAVDRRFQGHGLGKALVIDAALRAASAEPACFALIVDAKDDHAAEFYRRLGFREFMSKPLTLFLPIATALQALEAE
jgi:ribosomal protein S18 acetylase RimI-like enzyme